MAGSPDDDLDDLVRTAMKTLDGQVPSGYFDALAGQTLARLAASEATMQTGTSSTEGPSSGIPPTPEEDSGLHDIRNLAQTAKERISSKKISTGSTKTDEELLASASGSWKSLALPQPAAMISLPEVAELPPAAKVVDKATLETTDKVVAPATSKTTAKTTALRRRVALAGVGLAAAAGVTLFLTMRPGDNAPDAAPRPMQVTATAPAQPTVQPIAEPAPAPAKAEATPPAGDVAAQTATADVPVAAAAPAAKPEPAKSAPKHAAAHAPSKAIAKTEAPSATPAEAKPAAPATKTKSGDDSFDALLKEAGVPEKKEVKPVLDKKELSAGDFKTGMAAIQSKASACYKGTQGMAAVKLVVAPSGKVTRVTVSGPFADKPEGACVTAAVKSATFPAWDGGPQTMGYSFLLSE
jgi:hypothetical protein